MNLDWLYCGKYFQFQLDSRKFHIVFVFSEAVGSSQFELRRYPPSDDLLFRAMMTYLDGAQIPFDSRPSSRRSPFSNPRPSVSQLGSSIPSQSDDAFSLPSASTNGLGGFYKGKGN